MNYYFEFNFEKNLNLLKERGISFDQIIALIGEGCLLDVIDHPNLERYPNQKIFVVDVDGYCYLVPYVENGKEIFLKTIIPSRKATKEYLNKIKKRKEKNDKT
jgi:hypothetical protein